MDSLTRVTVAPMIDQPGHYLPRSQLIDYDELYHHFIVDKSGRLYLAGGEGANEEIVLEEPIRSVASYRGDVPDFVVAESGRLYTNARVDTIVQHDRDLREFRELELPGPVAAVQAGRWAIIVLQDGSVYYWRDDVSHPDGPARILFGRDSRASMVAVAGHDVYILARNGALYEVKPPIVYRGGDIAQDMVAARLPDPMVNRYPVRPTHIFASIRPTHIFASEPQTALLDRDGRMYATGDLWYPGMPEYSAEYIEVPTPEPLVDLLVEGGYTIARGRSGALYYAGWENTEIVDDMLRRGVLEDWAV